MNNIILGADVGACKTTIEFARLFLARGISVFPIALDGTKAPAAPVLPRIPDPKNPGKLKPSWEPFRDRFPTDAESGQWWDRRQPYGIGGVGGPISGNLAVLDFETWEAFVAWAAQLSDDDRNALRRCPVIGTPGGGAHVYSRLAEPVGGEKLARSPSGECVIETRGSQHYIAMAGSPPRCHKTGNTWRIRRAGWLDGANWSPMPLSVWNNLCLYAHELDEYVRPAAHEIIGDRGPSGESGDRPGDHFNERAAWSDILPAHGWKVWRTTSSATYWCRPGKRFGISASTGHCRGRNNTQLFYCFSSSAPPFEAERAYSKFAVYCFLNHGGDFCAATRALGAVGYGAQRRKAVR